MSDSIVFDPQATYKTKRHKLFWYDCSNHAIDKYAIDFESQGIQSINVGIELSKYLRDHKNLKFLSLEVEEYLRELIIERAYLSKHVSFPTVILFNLGMLLETSIDLDASAFLKELSKEIAIIILWQDTVEEDNIFLWDIKKPSVCLNFSNADIIKISLQ